MGGAIGLLVRSDLRRRKWATLALTLLVALAGTFVLTAATGALRADRDLERFLESTRMWDASIEVDYLALDEVLADVQAQEDVAAVSAAAPLPLGSDELDGGILGGIAPGWLDEVYRPRIVAGRLPDVDAVDELLVSESTAARQGLRVGDGVVVEDFLELDIAQSMTVVGIHRGIIDIALGDTYPGALATSAFGGRYGPPIYESLVGTAFADELRGEVVVRMRPGGGGALEVLEGVADRHRAARPEVVARDFYLAPVERSLAVQVDAFWVLTVASGATTLVLLGMAIARYVNGGAHPEPTLRALGLSASARWWVVLIPAALPVLGGAALALLGLVTASSLVPRGGARLLELEDMAWIDERVVVVGGLAFVVGVALVSMLFVALDRMHGRTPRLLRGTRGRVLPITLGADLAYRRGGFGSLALVATAIGVGLAIAVVTYSASIDALLDTPARFGSDYDLVLYPADESGFAGYDFDQPGVQGATLLTGTQVLADDNLLLAHVVEPVRGTTGGTVLEGRAPVAGDEVALGSRTADRLGLDIGDVVRGGSEELPMRIVGIALLPLVGEPAHGDAVWLTPEGAARLDVTLGETRLLLELADGITPEQRQGAIGGHFDEQPVTPDDVSSLRDADQMQAALALFGVLLAGGVLVGALVGIVRGRRRDLAILRALGCSPRGIRDGVMAAAALILVPGVLVALVAGIVVGRTYWIAVATGIPAVAVPAVPTRVVALITVGALIVGCLLALVPAQGAARIRVQGALKRD